MKPAETCTHTTKALLGLLCIFTVLPSFAQHPRIAQLIAEKQAKMEKLEKCQGTTKNLKIAGISTLGITAVGVGANIAEAVVLNKAKEDVAKAQKAHDAQQTIKDKRECEQYSTKMWQNGECKDKPVEKEEKIPKHIKTMMIKVVKNLTAPMVMVTKKVKKLVIMVKTKRPKKVTRAIQPQQAKNQIQTNLNQKKPHKNLTKNYSKKHV